MAESRCPAAEAWSSLPIKSQFFLPTATVRSARSLRLLSSLRRPSSSTRMSASRWRTEYPNAERRVPRWSFTLAYSTSAHAKNDSRFGSQMLVSQDLDRRGRLALPAGIAARRGARCGTALRAPLRPWRPRLPRTCVEHATNIQPRTARRDRVGLIFGRWSLRERHEEDIIDVLGVGLDVSREASEHSALGNNARSVTYC